jgi:tRNA-splicing ligase RtcB (3'-phosphate/5'-hydroxy nucleic acid ligase)
MRVISSEKIPIKMWLEDVEEGALDQAKNLANLPFAFKHVAIMPDCHQGYGMPIGGVLATKGVIIPNAVGVDIGCGMCAVKTNIKELSIENLKKILGGSKELQGGIRDNIPTGFNHHNKDQQWEGFDNYPDIEVIKQEIKFAHKQLGTLGGGNHFIEIQKDQDGYIWIMIHSGSRNFGYKIAHHYNKVAQNLCNMWYSNVPEFKGEDGLAFLPIGTKEAREYIEAMKYALRFALENRLRMIEQCKKEFMNVIDCEFEEVINIHHNYVAIENHFDSNVWVHRKGATSARLGEIGIIPGSQGTSSYIVRGLGNVESFMSCSHGAGRAMSRKKAQENLVLEDEQKLLDDKGILHAIRGKKDLDEASSAYKDIDIVMENQKDLVEIVTKLTPLAVVKG